MMKKRIFLLTAVTAIGLSLASGCGQLRFTGGTAGSDASAQSSVAPKYETDNAGAVTQTRETSARSESAGSASDQAQSETRGQAQTIDGTNTAITEDEARTAALADAGVSESDVTRIRVKQDWDDGRHIYEVEFYVGREEYDYDIDADTGVILSMDYDIDDDFHNGANGQGRTDSGDVIPEEDAVQIVLDRIEGAEASDVWLHLDYDDGRAYYEGEVYLNNTEYEFEMNASTGEILEWSEELYNR